MLILADEEIPCVEHYFGAYGEIIFKNGRSLKRQDVRNADILLVRSVTKIDEALLHATNVKFVGSTVSGTDHLNIKWLESAGIQWSAAVGCNAAAVAEYVVIVIAALQKQGMLLQKNCRAGVVGVGRIGSKVVNKLKILGFDVIQCDPLRAEQENDFISTPIEEFSDLDLILLHTPLTKEGECPTYHLIEKKFLQRQKKGCVLLNAGRGAVINSSDLMQYGQHLIWCLDVWENEPYIDKEVLLKAAIASPHIAGHSIQSKYRGIDIIYKATLGKGVVSNKNIESVVFPAKEISFDGKEIDWRDVLLASYDPMEVTVLMKQAFREEEGQVFDLLRRRYARGSEFEFIEIRDAKLADGNMNELRKIGFSLPFV